MAYGSGYGKKSQWVNTHADDQGAGGMLPAMCVKCHSFPSDEDVLRTWPDMPPDEAQELIGWAWDNVVEEFWMRYHGAYAREYFPGYDVEGASAGRSSGWLVVRGLPQDIEDWPIELVKAWRSFQIAVLKDIEWFSSWEYVSELVDIRISGDGCDAEVEYIRFVDTVLVSLLPELPRMLLAA